MTEEADELLWYTPHEVAALFRVDPKTLGRWEREGRFTRYQVKVIRTPGNHRRFLKADIDRMVEKLTEKGNINGRSDARQG